MSRDSCHHSATVIIATKKSERGKREWKGSVWKMWRRILHETWLTMCYLFQTFTCCRSGHGWPKAIVFRLQRCSMQTYFWQWQNSAKRGSFLTMMGFGPELINPEPVSACVEKKIPEWDDKDFLPSCWLWKSKTTSMPTNMESQEFKYTSLSPL